MIETARRAAEQKSGQDVADVSRMLEARIKDTNLYNRLRFLFSVEAAGLLGDSPLQHWVKHTIESETLRELTVAAIALKRYELRHGKPAPSLAPSVPGFLPAAVVGAPTINQTAPPSHAALRFRRRT